MNPPDAVDSVWAPLDAEIDTVLEIVRRVEVLAEHPGMRRPRRVEGTRELVLGSLPYVIPYVHQGDAVIILRVLSWRDEVARPLLRELRRSGVASTRRNLGSHPSHSNRRPADYESVGIPSVYVYYLLICTVYKGFWFRLCMYIYLRPHSNW
jgi:plasmid stabilization system protein ParE